MSERPSLEEIERGYVRQRPKLGPGMQAYGRFLRGSTTVAFWLMEILFGLMALYILADLSFGLGGGSRWGEFFFLLGLMLGALVFARVSQAWYAFIGLGRPKRED